MKKLSLLALSCAMLLSLVACGGSDDKTYTATADGYGGEVSVTITVDEEGNLTNIIAEGENETQGIGSPALEQIPQAILDSNSLIVDSVGGATVTSNAVIEATQKAIMEASKDFAE